MEGRPGVAGFEVIDDGRGSRCFVIVDRYGGQVPFSFRTCITGRSTSEDADARSAARTVVVDQILAFRDRELTRAGACAMCLKPFIFSECHVDHRPPWTFAALWATFLADNPEIDIRTRGIAPPGTREFVAPTTAQKWNAFHQRAAVLRLTCPPCNLSASRREATALAREAGR